MSNLRLIHPSLVLDGSINFSIVAWVVNMKHAGVAYELALNKALQLAKLIPGYESSRSCKKSQVKATVKSLYSNRQELHASKLGILLPEWLDPTIFSNQKKDEQTKPQKSCNTKTFSRNSSPLPASSSGLCVVPPDSELKISSELVQGLPGDPQTTFNEKKKIYVVRYKYRVGFFVDNNLILSVVKNRHYKFTKIIEHIETNILKTNLKLDVLRDVVHVRHNMKCYELLSKQLYSDSSWAIKAEQICGSRECKAISIEEFKLKKAEKNFSSSLDEHLRMHDGASFDYDESMFQDHTCIDEHNLDF